MFFYTSQHPHCSISQNSVKNFGPLSFFFHCHFAKKLRQSLLKASKLSPECLHSEKDALSLPLSRFVPARAAGGSVFTSQSGCHGDAGCCCITRRGICSLLLSYHMIFFCSCVSQIFKKGRVHQHPLQ